jgi:hypothetical protein
MDNSVQNIVADGDGVWVLTASGVTHIDMVKMTSEEKAYKLLEETLTYVQRHGMVSQKRLSEASNLKSALPYGHSDNDGTFTAGFAMGEMYRYATFKREKGADHPDWFDNFSVAAKLQARLTESYDRFARPINIRGASFNEQFTPGSLLIEIGYAGNTLSEAKTAAKWLTYELAAMILAEQR